MLSKVLFFLHLVQVDRLVDCAHPDEKVALDAVAPKRIEIYDPTAPTVFTFEESFGDTISIIVAQKLVLKQYMQTNGETGSAGRVQVKANPGASVIIQVGSQDCAQFVRRKGYKYVYVGRRPKDQWTITYSNIKRYYF